MHSEVPQHPDSNDDPPQIGKFSVRNARIVMKSLPLIGYVFLKQNEDLRTVSLMPLR
jgi:hypothetical protein